jgi:hypothetical protein
MTTDKIRENRARRNLTKHGYQLRKTPSRSWLRKEYGAGYIVYRHGNPVLGVYRRGYEATLVDVEEFVRQECLP